MAALVALALALRDYEGYWGFFLLLVKWTAMSPLTLYFMPRSLQSPLLFPTPSWEVIVRGFVDLIVIYLLVFKCHSTLAGTLMEVRHSHVALLPSVKFYSVPPHSLQRGQGKVTPSSRKRLGTHAWPALQ